MNLRIENLKKCFGDFTALDVSHCGIRGGRITGIVGPNGAGKSTLLNILAGLDAPTEGRVYYGDFEKGGPETEQPPLREITLLFQQPYMLGMDVEKNIMYPLKLRKVPARERELRVKELMEELGLTPLAQRRALKLSGGEAQKVALARALSFRPKLLLLDEPTSNIDNQTTADIEQMLFKINAVGGTTVAIVSHNLPQIRRVCDDVIFMNKGRVVEKGRAEDVLRTPTDPLTQRFIKGELLL